jgi:hypothetical protein
MSMAIDGDRTSLNAWHQDGAIHDSVPRVRHAAVQTLLDAVEEIAARAGPGGTEPGRAGRDGRARPLTGPQAHTIDWGVHETLELFAPNNGLQKVMRAESARRFADLRTILREASAGHAPRRSGPQHDSRGGAAARLKQAARYYEQHVLAWYALGRVSEARSARAAIERCREALAAETTQSGNRRTDQRPTTTARRPQTETRRTRH